MTVKTFIIAAFFFSLISCETCRVTSVKDAHHYEAMGYPTRIAVYRVGMDGKVAGMGRWDYHAQAQVRAHDRWLWVDTIGALSEIPAYSIEHEEVYYWRPGDYEAFLKKNGAYN